MLGPICLHRGLYCCGSWSVSPIPTDYKMMYLFRIEIKNPCYHLLNLGNNYPNHVWQKYHQ